MRLRASATVENAVIMPLFTIIIVLMIMLNCYIHDKIITKSAALKLGMQAELELTDSIDRTQEGSTKQALKSSLSESGSGYVSAKSFILKEADTAISEDNKGVTVKCSGKLPQTASRIAGTQTMATSAVIYKNAPDNFVRIVNAVKKAIE